MQSGDSALSDIKVVDLSTLIAGPYCTKLLADFGAEVVKVEPPDGGDPCRRLGPFPGDQPNAETGGLFLYLNTNKIGVTLNIETATGKSLLIQLLRDADLLVESFPPAYLSSLGLGRDVLETLNPRLVSLSITPFGQTGPYRNYCMTEIVACAVGGLMYITGAYDREPVKHGLYQTQFWAGANGTAAALGALMDQKATGMGQAIDVSIMECIVSGLTYLTTFYTYLGAVHRRQPNVGGMFQSLIPVKDGYVAPVVAGAQEWETFSAFMEMPELMSPKFATPEARVHNGAELDELLLSKFATFGKHELFHKAQEWRFPFGLVQTPEDLFQCPQLGEREFFVDINHPVAGELAYPGAPFRLSESPWSAQRAAPLLGQHTAEVLSPYLDDPSGDLFRLRALGVV